MTANLNSILQPNANLGNLGLIHSSSNEYPLARFVGGQVKTIFANYERHYFYIEKTFDFNEVKSIIINGSLFNPNNYIELNFKTKPLTEQQNSLIEIFNLIDNNTFILISCDKLTPKESSAEFVKLINKNGFCLELTETSAKPVVEFMLHQSGLQISKQALDILLDQNQANLAQLMQEINKLILAIPHGTVIGITEIELLTSDNAKYNIYQLSNSYLAGDLAGSIKILDSLFQNIEDAILINWMIVDDLKKLLKIKNQLRSTKNIQQAIRELRLWGTTLDKLPLANKRLNYKDIVELYQYSAKIDLIIKGVEAGDIKLILTHIITKICTG
jgi:DNA polymerase III subunit delta